MEKTLKEILEETGIKPSTFQKYKTLDLLPRPTRIEMLKGHGSVAYYPENTTRLIQWINEWKADGESLKQIRRKLNQTQDVTPKEEVLIRVGSDNLNEFADAYCKVMNEVHNSLDPENATTKDFWVRFELIEKGGQKFYRVVSALSHSKTAKGKRKRR